METFKKEVQEFIIDCYKKMGGWRMLAKTITAHWKYSDWVAAKVRFIGRLFDDPLEKGYTVKTNGGQTIRCGFKGDVDELYAYVADYLTDNIKDITSEFSNLEYCGNENDLPRLKQVLEFVFELDTKIGEAVKTYVEKDNDAGEVQSLSYVKLANSLIYFHFSQTAFLFNSEASKKSKLMFHSAECKLKDAIVPDEVKHELFDKYKTVSDYLSAELKIDNRPKNARKIELCDYYARSYALADYLMKNDDWFSNSSRYNSSYLFELFNSLSAT